MSNKVVVGLSLGAEQKTDGRGGERMMEAARGSDAQMFVAESWRGGPSSFSP